MKLRIKLYPSLRYFHRFYNLKNTAMIGFSTLKFHKHGISVAKKFIILENCDIHSFLSYKIHGNEPKSAKQNFLTPHIL